MSGLKPWTRIDAFANMDEVFKFWEFAKARGATTREEMIAALEAYKNPNLMVEEYKERVEAHLVQACKKGLFKRQKKETK